MALTYNHPLGKDRFFAETIIKQTVWLGRSGARWSDAIREAGFDDSSPELGIKVSEK